VKTTRWALLLAFVGTLAHGADVYRSTDANGVPTYSDRPDGKSERVYVATSRPGRPGNPITPQAAPASATAAQAGAPQAAAAEGPQQSAAEKAAERMKNCTTARERQQKYSISHRLYREVANGEREYLTDGEMDEAKARAAADVATWCD
jgi:hypothetical protein